MSDVWSGSTGSHTFYASPRDGETIGIVPVWEGTEHPCWFRVTVTRADGRWACGSDYTVEGARWLALEMLGEQEPYLP